MNRRQAVLAALLIVVATIGAVILLYPGVQLNVAKILPATKLLPGFYAVSEVYDGDTFAVVMSGKLEKVRLIGVDTPETHKPDWPVECYGPQASDFTLKTLGEAGNAVRLEADPMGDNRDRYNRLLRYVYLSDGRLLQSELLKGGYAFAYLSFPFGKKLAFAGTQAVAQKQKLGLWGACQTSQDDGGRWHTNPLN